jgi:hypothetical protein
MRALDLTASGKTSEALQALQELKSILLSSDPACAPAVELLHILEKFGEASKMARDAASVMIESQRIKDENEEKMRRAPRFDFLIPGSAGARSNSIQRVSDNADFDLRIGTERLEEAKRLMAEFWKRLHGQCQKGNHIDVALALFQCAKVHKVKYPSDRWPDASKCHAESIARFNHLQTLRREAKGALEKRHLNQCMNILTPELARFQNDFILTILQKKAEIDWGLLQQTLAGALEVDKGGGADGFISLLDDCQLLCADHPLLMTLQTRERERLASEAQPSRSGTTPKSPAPVILQSNP